jgi:hypothetical protein
MYRVHAHRNERRNTHRQGSRPEIAAQIESNAAGSNVRRVFLNPAYPSCRRP